MTYEEAISELVVIKSVYSHMRGEYKPCVEALQMAIDLLRQADTPQTEKSDSEYYLELADAVMRGEMSDASANQAWYEYINKKDTPQTDCSTCKWGEWYRNGRDITTMDDGCGGCCSWNNKWQPREPQTEETEAERLDRIDNEIEDAWARIKELTPQTDCGWK